MPSSYKRIQRRTNQGDQQPKLPLEKVSGEHGGSYPDGHYNLVENQISSGRVFETSKEGLKYNLAIEETCE